MHTDYVDLPQPLTQGVGYILKQPLYGIPSAVCIWFQGYASLFDRLAAEKCNQDPSLPEDFRQEYIISGNDINLNMSTTC
jgi:hypothetical protein